ncbi:MAG TPA: hypothetical protein DCS93_12390 [Microscillaceae bacterium]|nr:hypothetical protein [Microscillaceae bacterium]
MFNSIVKKLSLTPPAKTKKITIWFAFVTMYVFGGFSTIYAQKTFRQRGIASYYIDRFDGRQTASGEIFDNQDLVGSHKKLPFNSMIKVTNLANNRSVIVRINDRGPYAHGRIIDVSKAAARKIGLLSTGTAKVMIEAVGNNSKITVSENPTPPKKTTVQVVNNPVKNTTRASNDNDYKVGSTYDRFGVYQTPRGYGIQVGYFAQLGSTKKYCREVKSATNIDQIFIQVGWDNQKQRKIYRVLVGTFATKNTSTLTMRQIKEAGYKGFLKPHFRK